MGNYCDDAKNNILVKIKAGSLNVSDSQFLYFLEDIENLNYLLFSLYKYQQDNQFDYLNGYNLFLKENKQ